MVDTSPPPAYAWDWFSRQRLLWREVRSRLVHASNPSAARYQVASSKADVLPLLRADYPEDAVVRDVVHRVVSEIAFLDRTDTPFARLAVRNPPRGMRWWWTRLTGEDVEHQAHAPPAPSLQLTLDDVHEGFGG